MWCALELLYVALCGIWIFPPRGPGPPAGGPPPPPWGPEPPAKGPGAERATAAAAAMGPGGDGGQNVIQDKLL